MKRIFQSIGPAIIVAAVVLGPGSILTSSKVGATFGLMGIPVVVAAAILMIAMVALSARLGVVYENSLCEELASRVGRPVTVLIGMILFILVALFQSSNNLAVIGGIEPMLGDHQLGLVGKYFILGVVNALVICIFYFMRGLYSSIENVMKLLIGLMSAAFLINFVLVMSRSQSFEPVVVTQSSDLIPLLGMIGTTFSVAGAFYQAYLVKEKGWGLKDAKNGMIDSVVSISILGTITLVVLLTAWRVFYGNPAHVELASIGDVARQLEPTFGTTAKFVFCGGILAGAFSSFLINALIGGTVMSDAIGKGARLSDPWPIRFTTLALVVGGFVAAASINDSESTVHLIMVAQALTVLGIPALALALIYLGTRPELKGERRVPKAILVIAIIGLFVSCGLAYLTASKVIKKFRAEPRDLQAFNQAGVDSHPGPKACAPN
ncbi:MAG: manganese transport protein [Mariniblastus sp.]|jgi:manganese transport protein